MNSVDTVIVVVLLVCGALGIYWGLIRQLLSIAGLVAGVVLASRYGPEVAGWLSSFIQNDQVVQALGFLGVVFAVSSLASLFATLLHRFAGLLFLGWLDHLAGGLLGLLQGALVVAVVVAIAAANPAEAWSGALRESQFAPIVTRVFGVILLLLPESLRRAADMFFGGV